MKNSSQEGLIKVSEDIDDMKIAFEGLIEMSRSEKNNTSNHLIKLSYEKMTDLSTQSTEMKKSLDVKMSDLKKNMTGTMKDLNETKNITHDIKKDVEEHIRKSIDDMKKNITVTKGEIDVVKKSLKKLTETIEMEHKMQRIEWGLSNLTAVVENFQFKPSRGPVKIGDSHVLIRRILMAFRDGLGLYLPNNAIIIDELKTTCPGKSSSIVSTKSNEKKRQEFRDMISFQIKLLTGSAPEVTKESDGRYSMYLS